MRSAIVGILYVVVVDGKWESMWDIAVTTAWLTKGWPDYRYLDKKKKRERGEITALRRWPALRHRQGEETRERRIPARVDLVEHPVQRRLSKASNARWNALQLDRREHPIHRRRSAEKSEERPEQGKAKGKAISKGGSGGEGVMSGEFGTGRKEGNDLMMRLKEVGIQKLMRLQKFAIKRVIDGNDIIIHSETGSGKTLCFVIPMLLKLSISVKQLQGLVLVPNLVLAAQIARTFNALQPGSAVALDRDAKMLPAAPVVVGPPLMMHRLLCAPDVSDSQGLRAGTTTQGAAKIKRLHMVVLDEVDAMFMTLKRFAKDKKRKVRAEHPKAVTTLLEFLIKTRETKLQLVACSATAKERMRFELRMLCQRRFEVVRDPGRPSNADSLVDDGGEEKSEDEDAVRGVGLPSDITVGVVLIDDNKFYGTLRDVIRRENAARPLYFIKQGASFTAEVERLRDLSIDVMSIEDAVRNQKEITPYGFSLRGRTSQKGAPPLSVSRKLLISSCGDARGLDVHGIDLVIIGGVPDDTDTFVHLAGRTGRMGARGRVILLATFQEANVRLPRISRQLGILFEYVSLDQKRHKGSELRPQLLEAFANRNQLKAEWR